MHYNTNYSQNVSLVNHIITWKDALLCIVSCVQSQAQLFEEKTGTDSERGCHPPLISLESLVRLG